MPPRPLRLLEGPELEDRLRAATAQLYGGAYDFSAADNREIEKLISRWDNRRRPLDLDQPSRFSYLAAIDKHIKDGGLHSAYRHIAAILLVCHPEYPEAVDYLRKITRKRGNKLQLVEQWDFFATSSAWRDVRRTDGVANPAPAAPVAIVMPRARPNWQEDHAVEDGEGSDEDDSSEEDSSEEDSSEEDSSEEDSDEDDSDEDNILLDSDQDDSDQDDSDQDDSDVQIVEDYPTAQLQVNNPARQLNPFIPNPKYPFSLFTDNNSLSGFSFVTTLLPANKNAHLSSHFTLRIGWYAPTGATVLGVLKQHKRRIRLYAAAYTIDEKPLRIDDIPTRRIPVQDVVVFEDFGSLDLRALGTMLRELSTLELIAGQSPNPLHVEVAKLAKTVTKPLEGATAVSEIGYGPSYHFIVPDAINKAHQLGRNTGIYNVFAARPGEPNDDENSARPEGSADARLEVRQAIFELAVLPMVNNMTPAIMRDSASLGNDQAIASGSGSVSADNSLPISSPKPAGDTSADDRADLDDVFEHAKAFMDRYLKAYPEKKRTREEEEEGHSDRDEDTKRQKTREDSVEFVMERKVRQSGN